MIGRCSILSPRCAQKMRRDQCSQAIGSTGDEDGFLAINGDRLQMLTPLLLTLAVGVRLDGDCLHLLLLMLSCLTGSIPLASRLNDAVRQVPIATAACLLSNACIDWIRNLDYRPLSSNQLYSYNYAKAANLLPIISNDHQFA